RCAAARFSRIRLGAGSSRHGRTDVSVRPSLSISAAPQWVRWTCLRCGSAMVTIQAERPGRHKRGAGSIRSGPPPLLTVSVGRAAGSVAIASDSGPPPLSAVTAYGPPGTARTAVPPPVLSFTDFGAAEKTTVASPPPVTTVAVAAAMSRAIRVPPSVTTVTGPPICVARVGPPPESTFAPAVPETVAGPPPVETVAVTPGGTVILKSTLQPVLAHAVLDRASRPSDTACTTAGSRTCWSYMIVSVTWTLLTGPDATCTWPP